MPEETKEVKLDASKPAFQPPGFAENAESRFESAEIMWWDNGIWGRAGYAIPNDGGKSTTANETIRGIHDFIGAELFNLMHRPDVKMSRPFNAEWLFNLNKMLTLGIKRMADYSIGWTDKRKGDAAHAINTPEAFIVYPVPYFGQRIRQKDARRWCGQILRLLSEIMQHSDNEFDDDVTAFAASMIQEDLRRIQGDMAMKYLGKSRAEVETAGFVVPPDAFSNANYKPDGLFTEREMVEERMPLQWWPTANDLTPIAGIPITVANVWGRRWPEAGTFYGDGGAQEAAWPGGGIGIVAKPGARP